LQLTPALQKGILLRRYKRFLADVELASGAVETMHCPNTGAMTGCAEPGSECWFSRSANPRRKYSGTLEVVVSNSQRISVNTGRANALIREALQEGRLTGFTGAAVLRSEVAIPDEAGRFDLLLDREEGHCLVEIKSVTLAEPTGLGLFPDTRSERALKHVRALTRQVRDGAQAALIFCVQHTGIDRVSTAADIDPEYAAAVLDARSAGVEIHAYGCSIEPEEISVRGSLPVIL
jgi:sugar fermentation stimulation protein A